MATLADFPVPWVFVDLNDGEGANVNKRASGDRVMDNLHSVADYIFFGEAEGANADNNGSDANTCRLILKTDDGDLGIAEAGDYAMVIDQTSANVWSVKILVNDQLAFTDANLDKGTLGVIVYDSASLRNNLYVTLYKRNPCWTAANISSSAALQDPFTFDKMETSGGAVCETRYETLRTDGYNVFDAAGLLDETVGAEQLSEELFANESRGNFLWGDYGRNSGRNTDVYTLPDQVAEWNAPGAGTGLDGTHAFLGDQSIKVIANVGGGGGISIDPDVPWQVSDFQGQFVAITKMVYSDTIDGTQVGVDDGVNPITWSPVGPAAANEWLPMTVVHEVAAAATRVRVIVRATQAGVTFWVDAACGTFGTTPHQYTPNETQRTVYKDQDNDYENLAAWSGFELRRNAVNTTSIGDCWFDGISGPAIASGLPNGWLTPGVLGTNPSYYDVDKYEGYGCMRLRLVLGENIYHYLGYDNTDNPVTNYVKGKPLTEAFWIKKLGAPAQPINITVRIAYQVGTVITNTDRDFYIDGMTDWTRCAVTVDEIPSNVSEVVIYLMHNDAGAPAFDVLVDAEMLTASLYAVDYRTSAIWREKERYFTYPGALVALQEFYAGNIQGASRQINESELLYGCHLRLENTGAGPGSNDVVSRISRYTTGVGWATANLIGASVGGGAAFEEAWGYAGGSLIWIEVGDRLRGYITAISTVPGQNAQLTVYGLTFGK